MSPNPGRRISAKSKFEATRCLSALRSGTGVDQSAGHVVGYPPWAAPAQSTDELLSPGGGEMGASVVS